MAQIVSIQDLSAPELAAYSQLTNAQLRSRLEPEKGIFIAESAKVISTALDAGYRPISLLMERQKLEGPAAPLLDRVGEAKVFVGERALLSSLTGYPLTRGILCAMARPVLPAPEEILRSARRVAVLEGIVDATNIGAIFRSAAALNMDAVLLTPTCCDPLNRRAVRVSMGAVFQVPWAGLEGTWAWPQEGLARLKELGFVTAAMALGDGALPLDSPRLQNLEKLALVLGAEGDGLSQATIARCDHMVRIPMAHGVDSLNVAAASAVAFWQFRVRAAETREIN